MGIVITSNVDASDFASKAVSSVQDGLRLMCFFDTSKQKATNNYSIESNGELREVGDIILNKDGSVFNAVSGFIETDIDEPNECSAFIVARANKKDDAFGNEMKCSAFFGNSLGSTGVAFGYQHPGNGLVTFGRRYKKSDGSVTNISMNIKETDNYKAESWAIYYVMFGSKKAICKCLTSNESIEQNIASGYVIEKGSAPMMIGSYPNKSIQKGDSNISQLRFYDRALSDQEIEKIAIEMRKYELSHNKRVV